MPCAAVELEHGLKSAALVRYEQDHIRYPLSAEPFGGMTSFDALLAMNQMQTDRFSN
jgi:hypothetical protein